MKLDEQFRQKVAQLLWSAVEHPENEQTESETGPLRLYAIIDASRDPIMIPVTIQAKANHYECLYRGKALEEFGDEAAWAVELLPDETVLDWLLEEGYGNRWAIFIVSAMPLHDLTSHLRKFTMIEDDEGKLCFFRFYDPQTLRQFLPVFDGMQQAMFFRGISELLFENTLSKQEAFGFRLEDGKLKKYIIQHSGKALAATHSPSVAEGLASWS